MNKGPYRRHYRAVWGGERKPDNSENPQWTPGSS